MLSISRGSDVPISELPKSRACFGQSDEHGHMFGGSPRHGGSTPRKCKHPLHLVLDLSLADPLLPLQADDITRLPLYFPFRYESAELAYRVLSDDEIQVMHLSSTTTHDDWPYEAYPECFSPTPLARAPLKYDEYKTIRFADEYLHEGLSPDDTELLQRLDIGHMVRFGGRFSTWQGGSEDCRNRKCEWIGLEYITVVPNEPFDGISLWGEFGGSVQTIFKICPKCGTIHAFTECD